jgi:membrane-associated phospholipid phosphatase
MAWIYEHASPEDPFRTLGLVVLSIYAISVVFGRIYCGMHSITGNYDLSEVLTIGPRT